MKPALTVLLSVHNGMPFVPQAVDSILRQSFADFELLILDDASTDGTAGYLRGLRDERVRLVFLEQNIGLTAALNRGLREAKGELVARQDADDVSHPERLARQFAFLRANPKCGLVGSQAHLVDGAGRSLGRKNLPLEHGSICFAHLFDNAFAHSSVMFRRAAVEAAGGYDETWRASQDYELWSRLSVAHELANLPERLVTLRVLESSITRTVAHSTLIRRVQTEHYRRHFGGEAREADLDLIALVRSRIVPERLREFRGLLEDLVVTYAATHPGITESRDFRRMLALLHERIGYNLLTLARGAAWGELRRAWQAWPPSVLGMPWLRIMALTCLGDGARNFYGKLGRR